MSGEESKLSADVATPRGKYRSCVRTEGARHDKLGGNLKQSCLLLVLAL